MALKRLPTQPDKFYVDGRFMLFMLGELHPWKSAEAIRKKVEREAEKRGLKAYQDPGSQKAKFLYEDVLKAQQLIHPAPAKKQAA